MRFKLDENLGPWGLDILRAAGHDASTVLQQKLSSTGDRTLMKVCRDDRRCLVTLDLDFANPLLFRPVDLRGTAVLRLPPRSGPLQIEESIATLVQALTNDTIDRKLWIIQRGHVREYRPEEA